MESARKYAEIVRMDGAHLRLNVCATRAMLVRDAHLCALMAVVMETVLRRVFVRVMQDLRR